METFIQNDSVEWEILEDRIRRKILSHDPNLMLVKVEFQKGTTPFSPMRADFIQ
ncbi:hypothetical protein V7S79_04170 [Aquirufa sp. ROCK-SH2]